MLGHIWEKSALTVFLGTMIFALTLVFTLPAIAQVNCGDQPKDVPPDVQQKLSGDVQGKAQLFTKLLGDADLTGKVNASKKEVYQNIMTSINPKLIVYDLGCLSDYQL